MRFSGNDHTLLADAIMTGNVEIAKKIIPYTKVEGNPKGRRFGSYLHLAAKYGQPAILEALIFQGFIMNYKELKDKEANAPKLSQKVNVSSPLLPLNNQRIRGARFAWAPKNLP